VLTAAKVALQQCYVEVGDGCQCSPAASTSVTDTTSIQPGCMWKGCMPTCVLSTGKCSVQSVAFTYKHSATWCVSCPPSDQGGLGGLAADVFSGSCLTCKDSVLVGWGGALEDDDISCPVLEAQHPGSTINVERCTLQLHPDSTYSKPAIILRATEHASVTAADCKLIGPAPANSSGTMDTAAFAESHATICLVSAAVHPVGPGQSADRAMCFETCRQDLQPCEQLFQVL
jgi:hypothetical protein